MNACLYGFNVTTHTIHLMLILGKMEMFEYSYRVYNVHIHCTCNQILFCFCHIGQLSYTDLIVCWKNTIFFLIYIYYGFCGFKQKYFEFKQFYCVNYYRLASLVVSKWSRSHEWTLSIRSNKNWFHTLSYNKLTDC